MGQKWYRKNVVKSIWILAEHVFLLVMAASFLWLMSYPVLRSEIFNGTHADQYEDTKAFADQVLHTGEGISAGIAQKEDFETDGYYDPDKIIDAAKYVGSDVAGGESESLSYRLEDMVAWGEALNQDTGEAAGDEGNIIVCRRSDGTYHYYEYSEFQDLIQNGELSFVMASEEGGMTQEEILLSLRDRTFSEGMSDLFKGVQDQEGRILYVDCWNYDGYWYKEECKTAEGKSILDVANEDPAWNGHLSEAFDIVETAVQSVYWNMDHYQRLLESYQEGDTNLTYLYVDQTAKEIVSNREEYREGQDLEATLDKIRESGKYAIIYPRLVDFETNMKNVDAAEWRNALQVNGKEDAYIFALSVDTTYPVQDSFYTESQTYAQYGGTAVWVFAAGVAAAILFALGLIWLTLAAGRRPEDEALHLNSFDHWKTEIAALLVFVLWLVPVLLLGSTVSMTSAVVYDEYGRIVHANAFQNSVYSSTGNTVAMTVMILYSCAMFLAGYLSLVRRIKAGTLWKDSLLRSIVKFIGRIFQNLSILWRIVLIFGVVILFHWIAFFSYGSFFFFGLMVLSEVLIFVYMIKDALGKQRIKKGIEEIAGGQVDYKIHVDGLPREQQDIGEKINSIGEGLDRALEKSIKSERLKTDLITNVSHDIKTPLTSIINYVELLKQENFEDPRIRRYIEVLEQKSQRLKTLTEDVVEASKVSSGNITLEYMNINFVEMIQQTSGEFEEKFKARNLTEVLNLPQEEVMIRADGRRMWRVLANIYNNAAKYALEGTRVYADLQVVDGHAVFSLKNISQQQLNISADELTERFIRGDISRSTEGSGLGLSIAKTLTEMQGGKFELYLDGDLFRVTITF